MIPKELLNRINELARKGREAGLTAEEAEEQRELRARYLAIFKRGMADLLDHTVIQEPDGTRHRLKRRE